jgi:hypothetical protein
MRRVAFVFLFLLAVGSVQAQTLKNGIGLRLGEPFGITYKHYLPKNKAVEFIVGTAHRGWGNKYYRNYYEEIEKYDDYIYRSHEVKSTVFLEARYLFQYTIPTEDLKGTLQWYWGIGGLLKVARVEYQYEEMVSPNNTFRDERTDIDIGPEAIGGIELTLQNTPVSFFGESSLIFEIVDQPLALRFFGAVGARYNF